MNLNDLVNMIHTDDCNLTVFVFDDEVERDDFRQNGQPEGILFVVRSQYVMKWFIQNRFAEAKVHAVCLVDKNTVDVIIDGTYKNQPKED